MLTRTEKIIICIMILAIAFAAASFLIGNPAEACELPVVTLIQNEPEYHDFAEEYNPQKFANPVETLTREADISSGNGTSYTVEMALSYVSLPNERLTKSKGVFMGPSGRETWYNLNMSTCVKMMRNLGFSEEEYPVWVRSDGAKMMGDYVMCAANLETRPKGTIVESSLGLAIVVDTGGFAKTHPDGLDLCTNW